MNILKYHTEKRFLPLPSVIQIRREDYWPKDNNKLKSCIFTLHFKSRLATQFSKRNVYFWQVDVLWISENQKFILLQVFYLMLWKIYSTWKDIIIWINPSRRHSYFFFFAKHYKNCSWDYKIYWYKQSKKEASDRNSTLQTQFFLCTWTMKELIDY